MFYGNVCELDNGIKVVFSEKSRFKVNSVSVDFIIKREDINPAAARLLFKMLPDGTEKYPTFADTSDRLNDLYDADVSGMTRQRGIYNNYAVIAEYLKKDYIYGEDITDGIFDFIDQIIFHPYRENGKINPKYFDTERKSIILSLKNEKKKKPIYANRKAHEKMFEGKNATVYPHGTVADFEALTEEDIDTAYYDILNKSYIIINCVGDFERDKTLDYFGKMFSYRKDNGYFLGEPSELIYENVKSSTYTELCDVNQSVLCLGYVRERPMGSYGDYQRENLAQALFNEILGSSPTSKLFMNVREKESLCYSCGCSFDKEYQVFSVVLGINASDMKKAEKAVIKQIEDCQNGIITEEELATAKRTLINERADVADSVGFQRIYNITELFRPRNYSEAEYADYINSFTLEEVIKAAGEFNLHTVYFLKSKEEK